MAKKETRKEIMKLLKDYNDHISSVEEYIKSSFNDINKKNLQEKEEFEKTKDISSIKLSNEKFPLDLNVDYYFNSFLHSAVLKPFESKFMEENFKKFYLGPESKRMCYILFCLVFMMKYPDNVEDPNFKLLINFRKEFSHTYVRLFSELPRNKEELINLLIFSICYTTHMIYFFIFPKDSKNFKIRFILDVYHIALFELNGVYVSDYYLQNNFERMFTSKFMDYEQQNSNGLFLKKMAAAKQNNSKSEKPFFEKKNSYPNILYHEGGIEFAEELSYRLKSNKRSPRRQGLANNNKQKANDHNKDFEEARHEAEDRINQEEHKKLSEKLNTMTEPSDSKPMKTYSDINFAATTNFSRKFNCIQISPTVSNVLDIKNMSLPFNRKKVISHVADKLYTQSQDYKEIFEEIYSQRKTVKETKVLLRTKPNFHQDSLASNYGSVKVDYDDKAKKFPRLFNDMEELYTVLNKYDERLVNLDSSKLTLSEHKRHNILRFNEITKEAEEELNSRPTPLNYRSMILSEQKKLLEVLEKEEQEKLQSRKMTSNQKSSSVKNDENTNQEGNYNPEGGTSTMVMFKLPFIANKLMNATIVGKERKNKGKTLSEMTTTIGSNLRSEEENQNITQTLMSSTYKNKVKLNAIVEEGGNFKKINMSAAEDEEEEVIYSQVKNEDSKNLFIDKRKQYSEKYGNLLNRNPDENIDELIGKIISRQNHLNRSLEENEKKIGSSSNQQVSNIFEGKRKSIPNVF